MIPDLIKELSLLKNLKYLNFVICCNYGSTFHNAFDDALAIRKAVDLFVSEHEGWNYTIHLDAAL